MKKFAIVSLITAGIMFLAGCLLASIGAIGGKHQLTRFIIDEVKTNEKIQKLVNDLGDAAVSIADSGVVIRFQGEEEEKLIVNGVNTSDISGASGESASGILLETDESGKWYQVPAESIRKLELELGAGSFIIEEKDTADGVIEFCFDGFGDCTYDVDEETLVLGGFKGISIGKKNNNNQMKMKVPKDSNFEEVKVEVGAGIMELSDINIGNMEAEIGAGEFQIEGLTVENLNAEIGLGELTISETVVRDAALSVSMGECIYEGMISGDLDAACDMGNMELILSDKEKDHNYKIECDAGTVSVGDFDYAALGTEREVNNGASSTFDISCHMGNITVVFED